MKSFFKQPQPKKFQFKTRFYDENKERLQQQIARTKAEMKAEEEGKTIQFKDRWLQNSKARERKKSNYIIALIVSILALIFYFLLK
jgi:NH3-dependent NAD+ synthetase